MFDRPQFLGEVPIAGIGGMSVSVPRARFLRRRRFFPSYYPYAYPYPYQYPSYQPQMELVCRSEKTESGEEIFRCTQEAAPHSGDLICRKEKNAAGEDVLRCTQQQPAAFPGYYPGAYPVVNYPGYF